MPKNRTRNGLATLAVHSYRAPMVDYITLRNQGDLDAHIQSLIAIAPEFAPAYQLTGPIMHRIRENSPQNLLRAVVGQQVSVASANAIWKRLDDAGYTQIERLQSATPEALRELGASRQKARYLIAIAQSGVDFDALPQLPDDAIIKELTAITGIGIWSAEIYLMFSLGRADVLATGDLALQEATRLLFQLNERPNEKRLREIADAWSPYRNAAAHLLWAYYHIIKDREGV